MEGVTGYNLNRNAPFWVSPTAPLGYAEKMARHSLSVLPVIITNACCCFDVKLGLRKKRQYAALENCDVFYLLQMYQMKWQILNEPTLLAKFMSVYASIFPHWVPNSCRWGNHHPTTFQAWPLLTCTRKCNLWHVNMIWSAYTMIYIYSYYE